LGKFSQPVKEFWRKIRAKSRSYALVLTALWLVSLPLMVIGFKSDSVLPFLVFSPVWLIGLAAAIDSGWLLGNHLFFVAGLAMMIEAAVKLLSAVILVEANLADWVYLSIPFSLLAAFLFGWFYIRRLSSPKIPLDQTTLNYFPQRFFSSSLVNNLSTIAFLGLDVVLAKIFLSPEDAGRFALLSLVGKMIYFIGTLFTQFTIPIVSKNEGAGLSSAKSFYQLLLVASAASGVAYVSFGIFGNVTGPILFGPKIIEVARWLPIYGAAVWFQTVGTGIVAYHQVKNRHAFAYLGFGLALIQVAGMLVWHRNINDLVWVMLGGGAAYLLSLGLLHRYWSQINTVVRNLKDFLGLFVGNPLVASRPTGRLRILMFNWRDTRHVWAGGAEVYLHQIAKRLVKMGHKVTLFCGNDGHSPRNQVIDGVQIVRRGGFYTVYIWACLYYLLRFRRYFDVIIDSENGIPFFTPLYANKKIFLLIHHVHQEVFRLRLKPPLSWIGQFLEKHLMPAVYRGTEVITVSPSSKAEILAHRLTKKEPHVIYNGVDSHQYRPGKKSPDPLVLYLGRLMPQKSLSVLINAAAAVIKQIPRVKFVIAGDGEDKRQLMALVGSLGLEKFITFTGAVSEAQKVRLYQQAWVFVNPSLIEGWGITTIEANACGTPVVAANVPGLKDAVSNPHTGLLVPYGETESFARAISLLLENKPLRCSMSQGAIDWAKQFDWGKSSRRLLEIL
jgi:glycosyltransferase involved in cell wall biosynthesis/O-antigen/teichoic acid export membrane protein